MRRPVVTDVIPAAFPDWPCEVVALELAYGGGGTNCSRPRQATNVTHRRRKFVGCILISDQESWIGAGRHGSTATMTAWQDFVKNQVALHGREFVGPRLVGIALQPDTTTQAPDRSDILNVGGFSDAVFEVVAAFPMALQGRC